MLVVFADSHGDVKVLDGYCRHMGGNLSQGTIKGDEVACPFHDWRWGGDGKCKLVPYASAHRDWPALVRGRPMFAAVCCSSGTTTRAIHRGPRSSSRYSGVRQRRLDRLALELAPHRGLQLPRHHRQRHRHGALLLYPFRSPYVLQERFRGPHRFAVPAQRRPPGHQRPGHLLRRGTPGFGGVVLRPVVHDQLAAQQLRRLQGRVDPDQLPLPGHPGLLRSAVGCHRREARRASTRR